MHGNQQPGPGFERGRRSGEVSPAKAAGQFVAKKLAELASKAFGVSSPEEETHGESGQTKDFEVVSDPLHHKADNIVGSLSTSNTVRLMQAAPLPTDFRFN